MKKYIVEFIGTFFLVLSIIATVSELGEHNFLAPIGIGCALIALIYAGGHISRAHYNPVVTLAFLLKGEIDNKDVFPYLLAQLFAGGLAALIATTLLEIKTTLVQHTWMAGLTAELLGTFMLVFVILNVAIAKTTASNEFYGLAIGFTVIGMAYALGGKSWAAFNPAVALSLSFAQMMSWSDLWFYLVGSLGGSLLAVFVFNTL